MHSGCLSIPHPQILSSTHACAINQLYSGFTVTQYTSYIGPGTRSLFKVELDDVTLFLGKLPSSLFSEKSARLCLQPGSCQKGTLQVLPFCFAISTTFNPQSFIMLSGT